MARQIYELPTIATITDDVKLPCSDPLNLSKNVSIGQLKAYGLGGLGGGGSGVTQELQNVVNGQNSMNKVPQANSLNYDFMSDVDNVIFSLATNYAQGNPTIQLTFVQPANLGEFKQKHLYPFRTQIYDALNKSYMVLTDDNNAADSATTVTFTLATPLVNLTGAQIPFNTSDTVAKLQMLISSNGSGAIPSGLTGQAAQFPENLNIKYLSETKDNAKLETGINFNPTMQYKITSISGNNIVVQANTDDSAMFPATDAKNAQTEILAYNLIDNYFRKLTLSSAATYSSSNLSFTVNENTNEINTSTWYIIKSPIISARFEDIGQAGETRVISPNAIVSALPSLKFEERFNFNNTSVTSASEVIFAGNWIGWSYGWDVGQGTFGISNNAMFLNVGNASTSQQNYTSTYKNLALPIRGRIKMNVNLSYQTQATSSWNIGIGANKEFSKTTGFSIGGDNFQTLNIKNGATIVAQAPYNYSGSYIIEIEYTPNKMDFYFYSNVAQKPSTPMLSYNGAISFPYSILSFGLFKTGGWSTCFEVDNILIYDSKGSFIQYSLPNQSGNKITISSALPIADTVNEVPIQNGIGACLA